MDLPMFFPIEPPLLPVGREQDCAYPGCRFSVAPYTVFGDQPSRHCTDHNRCSHCAAPNSYSQDLCGICAHRGPDGEAWPCMYKGCARVSVKISTEWPSDGPRFCYEHNTCTGCHKETQWAPRWCVRCMRDTEDNVAFVHLAEMKARMPK